MLKELYEINSKTCALVPNDNMSAQIIEENNNYNVLNSVQDILNYSCCYYGSSFKGRQSASKSILGSKYKLPIIIEETREIVFFPTSSYENNNCIWISLKNISNYQKSGNRVMVIFKNNTSITLNISYESFENQVLRATKLLLVLKSRKI